MRIFSAIKQLKILESFFLQSYQYTGNQFLISHCVSFQFIGHYIVDILDKDNIGVKVIEVLDQRTRVLPGGTTVYRYRGTVGCPYRLQ